MNSYSELPFQYKQDIWSLLFAEISAGLLEYCGRNGETSVRRAVRLMGKERGKALYEKMKEKGIPADLEALYGSGCAFCSADPRTRRRYLCTEGQKYLYEVDTCPLAGMWDFLEKGAVGNLFCEEFSHGQLAGYTGGTGQVNLSTRLTYTRKTENLSFMDDNVCRFSVYHRAANADPEHLEVCFGDRSGTPLQVNPDEDLHLRTVQICYYLIRTATEDFGEEGRCAAALALREAADRSAVMMKKHAGDLLQVCDGPFMAMHFPLPLDSERDSAWEKYDDFDARVLVQDNYLTPLKKKLGIA